MTAQPTITLATCPAQYYRATDDLALLHALQRQGIEAEIASWSDPLYQWETSDLVVIRSTWDYYHHRPEFLHWARRVASQTILLNPLHLVEWNTNKHYLRDLELQGVPIVPTIWNKPTQPEPVLHDLLQQRGWTQAVLKPAIAGDSFGVCLVSMEDEASVRSGQHHLAQMRSQGYPLMIQPFYPSVAQDVGEHSLITIAGRVTHAVRRVCSLQPDSVGHEVAIPLQEEDVRFARSVLSRLPAILYARVDIVRDEAGRPRLSELEVTEPRLFFAFNSNACDYLASVLAQLVHSLVEPSALSTQEQSGIDLIALLPAQYVHQQIFEHGGKLRRQQFSEPRQVLNGNNSPLDTASLVS